MFWQTALLLAGMHKDPEVFAHPDKFDISHFLGNRAGIADSASFRPFGHGRKVLLSYPYFIIPSFFGL